MSALVLGTARSLAAQGKAPLDNRIKTPSEPKLPRPLANAREQAGQTHQIKRAGLAGQLPGPPLKPRDLIQHAEGLAGLAGQLPGPPLKLEVVFNRRHELDGLAGQLPGPPLKL